MGHCVQVVGASQAPIEWDIVDNITTHITPEAIASLKQTRVGIMGEFQTGIGQGTPPSINMQLRTALNLYANVVSAFTIPGMWLFAMAGLLVRQVACGWGVGGCSAGPVSPVRWSRTRLMTRCHGARVSRPQDCRAGTTTSTLS